MPMNRLRRNGTLYIRLLLGITISIALTLIVASSTYYFSYTRVLLKETYETDLGNLKMTSQTVEGTTEIAQSLSFQIYQNSTVAKLLFYNEADPFEVQGAMLEMKNYMASMPFIQSIYVYNPAVGFYVVSNEGETGLFTEAELIDRNILDVLDHFQDYKPFTPIPRTFKIDAADEKETGIYSYLCYDAIGFDRAINSAVIVNLSAAWINREIRDGFNGKPSETYIVDDRGKVLSSELEPQRWEPREDALLERLENSHDDGYVVADFKGTKSLVSYTSPDELNWQYLKVMPYRYITEKTNDVRQLSIRIAAGILIGGLLLSWLLSKMLYVPIQRIVTRMNDLESEQRNASYAVRQNALRKLIQLQPFDPVAKLEKLRRTGISFDFTKDYRLVYIRIDRFAELKEQSSRDLLIYKFAVMNISSEVCSKYYRVEAVDLDDDDSLLLLMNALEPDETDRPEWLVPMLEQIQKASREYLRIGLTIGVGQISNKPHELHASFKQVKDASLQRFFRGRESIIETFGIVQPEEAFVFPAAKEKRMIDCLLSGKVEEATKCFRDILEETSTYPIQATESAVSHIRVSLNNILSEVQKNGNMQLGVGSDFLLPEFGSQETAEELVEAYSIFFNDLKTRLTDKRSNKQEDLIRKINELIEANFPDPNLSLNWIADRLDMSTFHISRVYRQHTLTPIVDIINQLRLGKATELLMISDKPIAEIAIMTGYTNSSYFHRMFKKNYGVTPAEFRKSKANHASPM
ncbi:AraC family transcriptional regulator [Cohnella suwonensis]|uniref:AraC family transcriptional regulator n=1 Tax=Cohnella suwonensis TaxID=696072 RepID=A0ABW0LYC5_9BACL